ncbi:MAG: chemotaxis protein CheA, partial [Bacteroidales bacterium]|nr:chemotaxis protein CheA [Bacteroidales bacterium]
YIKIFFDEIDEQLILLNEALVNLERDLENRELVNEIFRIIHTIKGNSATLGFITISSFTHKIENLLDEIRNNRINLSKNVFDVIFHSFDKLEENLNTLRETGNEPENPPKIAEILDKIISEGYDDFSFDKKDELIEKIKLLKTIKVPFNRLDKLLNLVGEMIIDTKRLDDLNQELRNTELEDLISHLEKIVFEMQYHIMDIRLIPLSVIFTQFSRLVRDLSEKEGKLIALELEGEDVQLDSMIIEKIRTPLVQIIRNAITHGIEKPDVRGELKKTEIGLIKLKAWREKARVYVAVEDDGRGIDLARVRDIALARGLVMPETLVEMDQTEVYELIFEPNFSTKEEVDEAAGRGVGLDAAKTIINSIGGSITVKAEKGKGTTFIIDLPVSLAVVKAILFRAADRMLTIPLNNIQRLYSVAPKEIKSLGGEDNIKVAGEMIPLVDLPAFIGGTSEREYRKWSKIPVIVVRYLDRLVGLVVDKIIEEQDIVIKPIGVLSFINFISGVSILGDGEIALILDVPNLIKRLLRKKEQVIES